MEIYAYLAIILILTLSVILNSTIIGKKLPNRELTISVIMMNLGVTLWQISLLFAFFIDDSNIWPRIAFASVLWALSGVLGVSLLFPDRKTSVRVRAILIVNTLIVALLSILILFTDIFIRDYEVANNEVLFGPLGITMLAYIAIEIVAILAIFTVRYIREKISRFYLRYIFLIFIAYLLLSFFGNLVLPFFGYQNFVVIGALLAILLQIGIEYALIANRLYKTNYLLGKVLQTLIKGAILYALFYITGYINIIFWGSITASEAFFFNIIMAFVISAISFPIFSKIDKISEERILYGKYPPEKAIESFSQSTSTELDTEKVTESIFKTIKDVTGVSRIELMIYSKGLEEELFTAHTISVQDILDIETLKLLMLELEASSGLQLPMVQTVPDLLRYPPESPLYAIGENLSQYDIHVILFLDTGIETRGICILHKKVSLEPFTVQDISFLRSLSYSASSSLARTILYEEVQNFNVTLQNKVDKATREIKERNEELQDLYNNLEDIYQKEKDLMDVAGHEFRTPASILKNNLYLLKKRLKEIYPDKSDEKIETYIERLIEGTNRQIKLINTFLESSRIDNKRFELQVDLVDTGEIVDSAVTDMKEFAEKKGLQVIFQKPQKKIFAEVDTTRMREVVDNLLNNAVKYTERGYIEVTLTDTDDSIMFAVKDTGVGIKKQDQVHLFKKFSRVEHYIGGDKGEGAIVRPGGTGLGLYVAKTIIDAHGGTASVESEIGKGSTFSFEIPKQQPSYVKRVDGSKTKIKTQKMVGDKSGQ